MPVTIAIAVTVNLVDRPDHLVSSAGFLRGWRWKGIHLQGAKVHPTFWDFPEAPETLLRQVRPGECQDNSRLWQSAIVLDTCAIGLWWSIVNRCISVRTGEPQGSRLEVRLHPGHPRHPVPGWQRAGGQKDRLWEEPQHPALCLWDAFYSVGQEAGRSGWAV